MSQTQPDPEVVFAQRMKRERRRRGWSQERLASEVNRRAPWLGMHPTAITKMEREGDDRRNVRLNEALVIAEAVGLTVARMLTNDDQIELEDQITQLDQEIAGTQGMLWEQQMHLDTLNAHVALLMSRRGEAMSQLAREREAEEDHAADRWASEVIDERRGK